MTSDLSQLGGFARASVLELAQTGYEFAGVENGIVRVVSPTGEPLEFTNDAYAGTSVCTWQSDPFVDSVSTDDGDFAASLGGAQLAPVYDDTSADDTPALDSPEWDADLSAALVEMLDDSADDGTPDPAPILREIADLGASPYVGCPPPANLAGCEFEELGDVLAEAPSCATTHENATLAFIDLGFDRATAGEMAHVAVSAGLHPSTIDLMATYYLEQAAEPLGSRFDRMPRDVTTHIHALVTRSNGARIAAARLEAHRGEKVLKTRCVSHELAPSVRVQIAEAAIVAEALRMLRGSADVYVLSTFDLSPESRPRIRGKRSVWNALDDAEKAHNVTWHCRRKTTRR